MGTVIVTQMVPQGLLVPRSVLGEWLERGVDVVKEKIDRRMEFGAKGRSATRSAYADHAA